MPNTFDHTLLLVLKLLVTLFIALLFLQSGFDKVFDFKGNLSYIRSVFAKTFLNKISPLMFVIITILEVTSGLTCVFGIIAYIKVGTEGITILGLTLAATSILSLFFGQRIAKDYAGAATLAGYFLLIIFGLFLFTLKG